MTSMHVICGLGPPNQKSWLRLSAYEPNIIGLQYFTDIVALFGYVHLFLIGNPFFFVDVVNRNWQRISVGFCSWLKQFI